jgi:hypothetical protein
MSLSEIGFYLIQRDICKMLIKSATPKETVECRNIYKAI